MVSDPSATDARQVRTRAKLLRAMLTLLEQGPFEGITVRALAAEAGVGYATFFRHYPDKEALLDDLAANEIAGLLGEAMPLFSAENTGRACVALFEFISRRQALWRALLTGGAAPRLREQFVGQARKLAAGSVTTPASLCPIDLRVTFATSATIEIIGWWLREPEELPIETIAGILDRLVITPTVAER
ncbi:TetR/AcrR family transcriptional regulator [Nannocystis punicea]|uniref:TetR/AcrR family transcriptional regulator n=1 Tax=Nannocystis punicea TaxID=2995304 RepID=A0ABY7GSR0_9BACT|nr:TetR/AcrR family transcriptional regulator [Nannocystis poenicansa]WAS89975.1 TetR/AcrR family transcriptional regulator [Nannocystis poenicansa]